jgi:sugar phosphate isomerase/epimerase
MKRISRRGALWNLALSGGGAMAFSGWPLPAIFPTIEPPHVNFPTEARARLAIATWPFRAYIESASNEDRDNKKPGMDLREFAAKIPAAFGVTGVEPLSEHFSSTDPRYLATFRGELEKSGLHVVNIPVDIDYSFYDADPAVRQKAVEQGMKWVDVAEMVGSPSVRTHIAQARNAKPSLDVTAGNLRRLVEYAANKSIVVNLENDDLVSEDAFFVVALIEKMNHPYLRALPDFCNSMATGDESFNYRAVTAMFQNAYNICHVKDSEAGAGGKIYKIDLEKTFGILKASGYRGYCSMEFEGQGDPYEGTRKLIEASLKYLG